jgi:hypothetical protein
MAKLGYPYADSDAALEDPRWNLESPSISDQQRATAPAVAVTPGLLKARPVQPLRGKEKT